MKFPLIFLIALTAAPVFAQTTTPSNPMAAVCAGYLDQAPGGVSGDHAKLCACLVRETPARLTQDDMTPYSKATLESKAPPDDVMQKVMAVATLCLQEAQ